MIIIIIAIIIIFIIISAIILSLPHLWAITEYTYGKVESIWFACIW